jgi:hypothetical protein
MTLGQFNALCDREWAQEARGDVAALSLTDCSYEELLADLHGRFPLNLEPAEGVARTLLNPVTRSVVKVAAGAASDTAEVYAIPESRTVTL